MGIRRGGVKGLSPNKNKFMMNKILYLRQSE